MTCGRFLEALGYNVLKAETPGEALKTAAATTTPAADVAGQALVAWRLPTSAR